MAFLSLWSGLIAQQSSGGLPLSFTESFRRAHGELPLKAEEAPRLNMKRILKEDEKFIGTPRFAAPIAVDYSLENAGQWTELADGGLLWRLKIHSEGALALAAFFEDWYLPPGSSLFMYSEDGKQVLGAYTFRNNRPSRQFMAGFIRGEAAVVEYYEPLAARGQGRFRIFRIDHAYRRDNFRAAERELQGAALLNFGFGTAWACHKNANCPEGDPWEKQKRSACRVVMVLAEGTGYCSGTLVNNTAEDGTPYVLSAYHCQDGYTPLYDLWRFDFSYQSSGCPNPSLEPLPNSVLGCVRRAGRQENDFLLLEATAFIPPAYHVYFSGWNRQLTPPQSGAMLHHPSGDIKKVALFSQPATVYNGVLVWSPTVSTPPNHHFRVRYSEGTFQPGSSGCALFGQDGRIFGQLNGGLNDCDEATGFFGRLRLSWTGGGTPESRLRDWLDPLGLDVEALDGAEQPALGSADVSGKVTNEAGRPIAGVKVFISGSLEDSTTTAADGTYLFEEVPLGGSLGLALAKADNFQNGLSTLDLIFISKHILGLDFLDTPIKMMAAEVNASNSLTTLDQIAIRKVILGIDLDFGGRPAWQFFPANFTFANPANPYQEALPAIFMVTNFTGNVTNVDFIGVKSGDIDDSANTGG